MSSRPRPTSASRRAWGEYGNARPDSQFDFGQDGIRDDPDLPAMLETDSVYNGNDRKGNSSSVVPASGGKTSTSFCGKIGKGIRSLWATRQTEDMKGDRELHVKTTLRELIVYVVFLVILCIVTFGMTSTTMYYYTKVMSDLFLDTTHTGGGSFRTITSVEDFWKFSKGPLIKGLYWETWYNNQSVPDEQLGYIYYENKLLGVPQLRQLQVHSNSCVVHDDFKDVILECYESYSESLENKKPFGLMDNKTAWYYKSESQLGGSSHWGLLATYSGAGYVQDLTHNKSESADIITYLFDNRWIQRGTRIVFIDFTVYNANINLFCVIRLTVEFPPTGGAIPHWTMRTVKLIRYVSVFDYFIMACEFIFCLFIIYYMIEEGIEIKKHRLKYFKSFWNILDVLVIGIAIVCVAFNIYRTIKVDELLEELLAKPDEYSDFEFLSYGQSQFDNAIAIAVFLAWIKIFKYISFNKTMTQLSSTLGKCAKDLAGFAVMFFIIFLAFTQLGYLLFGTQVKDFSNFQNSFFTLFRIILGDFDFDQLEAANRVLGPIFFMLFVFFVFFVLINMFLAIINDTYSEVKGDMANQKNEFEMTDYFKKGYMKMLDKLNFKHDKIVDIQKALQSADINNDKQVDFTEWRQDLKTRGYADGEIEALFAKYDLDGDRVLDEDEQRRMQADLNDQKAALSKEYDELEKVPRPESARRSTSRVSFNDDSADDTDDEDSHTKSSRSGPSQSVSYEEFTVLTRRVDRMEHSIGSIVSKIDAVLVKLEAMEKAKLKRRETMGKILDSITESDGTSDVVKREQMERLVREELERWDSETSITPQPSGRGASPSSSGRGGPRSRSRPGSGGNTRMTSVTSPYLTEEPSNVTVSEIQVQESSSPFPNKYHEHPELSDDEIKVAEQETHYDSEFDTWETPVTHIALHPSDCLTPLPPSPLSSGSVDIEDSITYSSDSDTSLESESGQLNETCEPNAVSAEIPGVTIVQPVTQSDTSSTLEFCDMSQLDPAVVAHVARPGTSNSPAARDSPRLCPVDSTPRPRTSNSLASRDRSRNDPDQTIAIPVTRPSTSNSLASRSLRPDQTIPVPVGRPHTSYSPASRDSTFLSLPDPTFLFPVSRSDTTNSLTSHSKSPLTHVDPALGSRVTQDRKATHAHTGDGSIAHTPGLVVHPKTESPSHTHILEALTPSDVGQNIGLVDNKESDSDRQKALDSPDVIITLPQHLSSAQQPPVDHSHGFTMATAAASRKRHKADDSATPKTPRSPYAKNSPYAYSKAPKSRVPQPKTPVSARSSSHIRSSSRSHSQSDTDTLSKPQPQTRESNYPPLSVKSQDQTLSVSKNTGSTVTQDASTVSASILPGNVIKQQKSNTIKSGSKHPKNIDDAPNVSMSPEVFV